MNVERVRAFASLLTGDDGVERAGGPGTAPTAFRIWKAGANPTDMGVHRFTARSAEQLAADQAIRGNLYSIDVDHLSLDSPQSPPEARKAVGWHKLAVRDSPKGPELWATDVEWTDVVRAGLEKKPPEWRYFSPAYDVDKESKEIMRYLNTALTNNPATWSVTALANATKGKAMSMKYTDILAALMGQDEEKKNAAIAALAAAFPDDLKDKDKGDDKDKDKPKDTKAATEKAAEDDPKEKAAKAAKAAEDADKDKDKDKATSAIAATRELATTVAAQQREIDGFKAIALERDRAAILATRKDLPEPLVKTLRGMPLDLMKATIEGIPVTAPDPAAAEKVQSVRGSGHGDGTGYGSQRAARLPPKQNQELRERMSGDPAFTTIGWDKDHPNDLVFPVIDKAEARRILAARAKAGTDGPARRPGAENGGAK